MDPHARRDAARTLAARTPAFHAPTGEGCTAEGLGGPAIAPGCAVAADAAATQLSVPPQGRPVCAVVCRSAERSQSRSLHSVTVGAVVVLRANHGLACFRQRAPFAALDLLPCRVSL